MKKKTLTLLSPRLLAAGLLLFSLSALAVDTDGDGVDDAVDAFPNDACASVDTDGDGMPNTMSCINEGFESGNFSSIWVNSGWFITTSLVHSGTKSARSALSTQLETTITLNTPRTLTFFYTRAREGIFTAFSINGVSQSLGVTSGWLTFSVLLQPGQHTLRWSNSCSSTLICSFAGYYGIDDITIGTTTALVLDLDDDNDLVLDTSDKFPLNAAATSDSDNDGHPDFWNACDLTCQANSGLTLDNCPSNANADQLNTDGDVLGDVCDTDDDNDGVLDMSDTFPLDPTESVDTDNDGIGNNADWDDDNDGVPDNIDAAPLNNADNSEIILPLNNVYKGSRFSDEHTHAP